MNYIVKITCNYSYIDKAIKVRLYVKLYLDYFLGKNLIVLLKFRSKFLTNSAAVFDKSAHKEESNTDTEKLFAKIGQLEMERDFLKKNLLKLGR